MRGMLRYVGLLYFSTLVVLGRGGSVGEGELVMGELGMVAMRESNVDDVLTLNSSKAPRRRFLGMSRARIEVGVMGGMRSMCVRAMMRCMGILRGLR